MWTPVSPEAFQKELKRKDGQRKEREKRRRSAIANHLRETAHMTKRNKAGFSSLADFCKAVRWARYWTKESRGV